jgi:signal transduction histidine kinase
LDQVIASVGLVVTSDSVSFLLVESREPGNTQVKIARQRGFAPDEPGESLLGIRLTLEQTANIRWMAETGKSLVIDQVRSYPGWVDLPQGRWIRSIVGAPVRIKDETIGFIVLASATPAFFTSEHAKRLEVFAAQAAIAIDNARLYEEVLAGRERLQAISVRLVQVQESERRRLARELHDEIGQALTGLKFSLEIGTGELDLGAGPPDMLRTRLWQASQQVSELIAKTRELSLALRPAMLDDLGLLPALIWQIDRYQEQTGIRVQFQASDLEGRRFPAELETAAYRIVQEALTNVARHAQVRQAAVRIWVKAAARRGESQAGSGDIKTYSSTDPGCKLIVSVEDHGAGFDLPAVLASRDGGGLAGMQERAALLGGRLTIEALPGTGTHLTAMLPI